MTHTQMRQIFGTTRWNRPSRFLGELPNGVAEHVATKAMSGEMHFDRYVDRNDAPAPRAAPWRHPQLSNGGTRSSGVPARSASEPPRGSREPGPEPGGRYVDHDFFDDHTDPVSDMPLRRGARVKHERFGDGEVLRVVSVGEPAVVAFFPGWGEKKILARFLKPA